MTQSVKTSILIVGAGFSGIGLAVMLKRRGINDFYILDRNNSFGGTWVTNTYPGAECDIQSHLYSFSFRPNPNWSKTYATQPEIFDYLTEVAEEENLHEHVSFGHDLEEAQWDEASQTWRVVTSRSEFESQVLVLATGHLSDPRIPDFKGKEKFGGRTFHSANWDHSYDLRGKKVGVVGTGASAIQVVPGIVDEVSELKVFQRSAPYVIPRQDTVYSDVEKKSFTKSPETARAFREFLFWANETRFLQRMMIPEYLGEVQQIAKEHREAQIRSEALLGKATPDYTIGCKRILLSNDWYPALGQDHVRLVDRAVVGFHERGVTDGAGSEHELDAVIFCSGFEAAKLPIAPKILGRKNTYLSSEWEDGSEAYGGMSVTGFPNMFLINGPHVGLGAGSIIFMIETQANYIAEAISHLGESSSDSFEVREDRQKSFVDWVDYRSGGTVWTEGNCSSWYLDERSGRLTTIWPDQMNRFHSLFSHFDPSDYWFRDGSVAGSSSRGLKSMQSTH